VADQIDERAGRPDGLAQLQERVFVFHQERAGAMFEGGLRSVSSPSTVNTTTGIEGNRCRTRAMLSRLRESGIHFGGGRPTCRRSSRRSSGNDVGGEGDAGVECAAGKTHDETQVRTFAGTRSLLSGYSTDSPALSTANTTSTRSLRMRSSNSAMTSREASADRDLPASVARGATPSLEDRRPKGRAAPSPARTGGNAPTELPEGSVHRESSSPRDSGKTWPQDVGLQSVGQS